ncbi:gliding motility-associated C-terminal domain-containing protein [Pedobacter panaciterrae]|uniref:gliding motility-associated C-terminal domain-containing protein n=1 Tax=Pedobacter panaciterrae TaxID=363849 RepID=UPI0025979CEF|nr:gliding motility-associated C-terminal domain-containing protein [uncultured Pedobacter sp.]
MKSVILFILILIGLCPNAGAQAEDNVWVFGLGAGLDFAAGTPTQFSAVLNALEGCASVADEDGDLLFYTNGHQVYNRDFELMPNGTIGVYDSFYTASQAALIVKVIGSDSLYYLFSQECNSSGMITTGDLLCTLVDMSLDSGRGDIVPGSALSLVGTGLDEKLTAVPGNCSNIWVLVHEHEANIYRSYEITEAGINPAPVISVIDGGVFEEGYTTGVLKASPDRTRLVSVKGPFGYEYPNATGIDLLDFDAATGLVSNRRKLAEYAYPEGFYGAAFSPDSKKLYVSSESSAVFQYDLYYTATADIIASAVDISGDLDVAVYDMKLGPDGKLYAAGPGAVSYIEFPDLAGTACNYLNRAIIFSDTAVAVLYGIPNVIVFPNTLLLDDRTMVHDTVTCDNIRLSGRDDVIAYLWNTGAIDKSIDIDAPGIYWVTSYNGCVMSDTFYVRPGTLLPPVIAAENLVVCPEEKKIIIKINADGTGSLNYSWSPEAAVISGQGGPEIIGNIDIADKFIVTVVKSSGICTSEAKDTISIDRFPTPEFNIVNNDTAICEGVDLYLKVNGPRSYNYWWNSSNYIEHPRNVNIHIRTGTPAIYKLTAEDANGCTASDSIFINTYHCCNVLIPNAFSPNGDGNNDMLSIVSETNQKIEQFDVFNRLGQRVFSSIDQDRQWDGKFNGEDCDLGVYFYYLRYTCSDGSKFVRKGDVTLLR